MDFLSRIILILVMFFQAFNVIFPSSWLPDYTVPEEPSDGIVDDTPTTPDEPSTDEPTTEEPSTECTHSGGKATCIQKAKCALCGVEYGDFGDHTYSSKTIKPTCTAAGRTYYTCSSCGYSYNDSEVPALGHDYKEETFDATCDRGGYIKKTCNNCGDTQIENTEGALGHDYTEIVTLPTCDADGYTTYTCADCGDTFTDDIKPKLGHSYTVYNPDGNATCTADGTETAYCDNGCGNAVTRTDENSMLPHVDENKNTYCDNGGEKLHIEFNSLQYPAEAVMTIEDAGLSVGTLTSRANSSTDIYGANCGYDNNGVFVSPYYSVKVDGTTVPVYATTVYVGESGIGALHSYSEIYIKDGAYATFEIELSSIYDGFTLKNAVVLPESLGYTCTAESGTVKTVLSGYGVYTFMVNDNNQTYTYTLFVREDIDEDAEIAELRAQGYTVSVVEGYLENWEYTCFSGQAMSNNVIYFRKGAYVTAKHMHDINSDADNSSISEDGASANNGMGLNRYPFISGHNTNNIKILGYGTLDLTHLDRGERRGMVFTFANNVEVRGIKLINAPEWTFITYRCDTVSVKNVDIFGYRLNSDALDICNSKNVTVESCFARSGDDIFGVKALGGDENAITDNIVFTDCYAWASKARAFGIVGECNRNISNVFFKDSYVLMHDASWDHDRIPAIGIVVETADANNGALTFDNVNFENIEIYRNDAAAMNVLIFNGVTNFTLKNINFRNVSYTSNAVLNRIVNYGGENSNNSIAVTFEGVNCNGTDVVDGNKTQYFSEESYWGNYITVK